MGVYDDGVADLYDRFVPAFFREEKTRSKIYWNWILNWDY